jgi:hypothetical protein
MKSPKPQPATNAPPGTVWFGGPIDWFRISLSLTGEDLVPKEVTAIMRREPHRALQKGKPLYRKDGSLKRIPKNGVWSIILEPGDTDEWDCGEAMLELLATLPSDAGLWRDLASRYKISFFVGLRMTRANKGIEFTPEFLMYLGERRISAGFDIYYRPDHEAESTFLEPTPGIHPF